MKELVPIFKSTIDNDEVNTVNARDLYKALLVLEDFSTWIKRRIVQCQLIENTDYLVMPRIWRINEGPDGARRSTEYYLSLFVAKHIAMLEQMEVDQYFADFEKNGRKVTRSESQIASLRALAQQQKALAPVNGNVVDQGMNEEGRDE
jgi:phage anti-repressor protein